MEEVRGIGRPVGGMRPGSRETGGASPFGVGRKRTSWKVNGKSAKSVGWSILQCREINEKHWGVGILPGNP